MTPQLEIMGCKGSNKETKERTPRVSEPLPNAVIRLLERRRMMSGFFVTSWRASNVASSGITLALSCAAHDGRAACAFLISAVASCVNHAHKTMSPSLEIHAGRLFGAPAVGLGFSVLI